MDKNMQTFDRKMMSLKKIYGILMKKAAEEQAAREAAAQELEESQGGETVYWVPNGKVYHSTIDCPSLGRSKTIYHGTIAESGKPRGCKNCY